MYLRLALFYIAIFVHNVFSAVLPRNQNHHRGEAAAIREYFYVGGTYINSTVGQLLVDQMYVEKLTPSKPQQPYPLVFIHGAGQTGTNWLNKPDGNPGWATFFLNTGYTLYIIDQTERARSAWNPLGNTTLTVLGAETIEKRFTAPQNFSLWPQANLHTQWPGTGLMGDPIFDAYFASTVQYVLDPVVGQTKMQAAGVALLRKIGPAVLIAHSQGGILPWVIADVVPDLVKAIVSLEPSGPPFTEAVFSSAKSKAWGIADIPLTYSGAAKSSISPLQTQTVPSNASGLATCIVQSEPARQLVNLKNIPVLLETGEASYHAVYDDCTYYFLLQAGVPTERLRLADVGLHGNGHLVFMEKNSDDVAAILEKWIKKKVE